MSHAYKCDRCGEFKDGIPNRVKVKEYMGDTAMGWANSTTIEKAELCDVCEKKVTDVIRRVLNNTLNMTYKHE